MVDFEQESSESDLNEDDEELQEAFAAGLLKPGLNVIEDAPKQFVNNVKGLLSKLNEIKLDLPWIELLDSVNTQAPMAPELAAKMVEEEEKRANQLRHNQKLNKFNPMDDPVLNDFKREMLFHRQAQASVMESLPKLKAMNLSTIRPEDYFAEMAKDDDHMQKIRKRLLKKQAQQHQIERVRQLRLQRKEGKAIQVQTKLQRLEEKRDILEKVKKVRKGVSKDTSFLDTKSKGISRKSMEKRKLKDKKFGFGGKKRGMKQNTKESSADISEYGKFSRSSGGGKGKLKGKPKGKQQRPGKSKRAQKKSKGRR